jgi:hypothetical protein
MAGQLCNTASHQIVGAGWGFCRPAYYLARFRRNRWFEVQPSASSTASLPLCGALPEVDSLCQNRQYTSGWLKCVSLQRQVY